jgi:ATP-dependent Lon protease
MTADASKELPLLALRSTVVFPGTTIPVEIGRLASLKLADDLFGRCAGLLVGTQRDPDVEEPAREDLYDVCVEGALVRLVRASEQRWVLKAAESTVDASRQVADITTLRSLRRLRTPSRPARLSC